MTDIEKTPAIYCIGDVIVDFIPYGEAPDGTLLMAPMPGGAPANASVAAAKLGARASFIGKVGDDGFGRMMTGVIKGYGVDTTHMSMTRTACTTMSFVTLTPDGDRSFTFARKPGADMMLSEDDVPAGIFRAGDILHFGSSGLIPDSPVKKAHKKALTYAKAAGSLIYFDPNVRLPLWDDPGELKMTILEHLPFADIVKVSDDELDFIFDTTVEQTAADFCFGKGAAVVFVTRGKNGAAVYTPSSFTETGGISVTAADTTGAGDAFNGAVMSRFIGSPFKECLEPKNLTGTLRFANAAGAFTVTRKGAMAGSPAMEDVYSFLRD